MATPRTAVPRLLRVHKRPTMIGENDAGDVTVTSGKPIRPDFRCYPDTGGQGPEALLTEPA